jgi:hypothetical protein
MTRRYDGPATVDAQSEPVVTVDRSYVDGSGTLRSTQP